MLSNSPSKMPRTRMCSSLVKHVRPEASGTWWCHRASVVPPAPCPRLSIRRTPAAGASRLVHTRAVRDGRTPMPVPRYACARIRARGNTGKCAAARQGARAHVILELELERVQNYVQPTALIKHRDEVVLRDPPVRHDILVKHSPSPPKHKRAAHSRATATNDFGRVSGPLSSCRHSQAALKCSYCSNSVTRAA